MNRRVFTRSFVAAYPGVGGSAVAAKCRDRNRITYHHEPRVRLRRIRFAVEESAVANFICGEAVRAFERQPRHAVIGRSATSQIDIPRTYSESSQFQPSASDEVRALAVRRFDVRIRGRY